MTGRRCRLGSVHFHVAVLGLKTSNTSDGFLGFSGPKIPRLGPLGFGGGATLAFPFHLNRPLLFFVFSIEPGMKLVSVLEAEAEAASSLSRFRLM